jgi:polysaccharide biosynthesis protein PslG
VGLAFTDVLPWMSAGARNDLLDKAVATHATWIRMDLPWRGVQPARNGPMTWELYDASVKAARDRGLHILMILGQAPEWARDSSCSGDLACPPASDSAFATFAAANARHYAGMGVHHYEIWNEPNVPGFWHGSDATRYGNLVKAAADAIHGADPQGQAILGGLAAAAGGLDIRDQVQFLTQICDTGACAKLDGVGYHPYTYPLPAGARPSWPTPWTRMSLEQHSLRSVLNSAGRSDLQFWVTEFGAPTDGPGRVSQGGAESLENPTDHVTEAVQADLAGEVLLTAAADSRVAAVFWHMLQDNPKAGGAIESSYGLLRSDGSPKPAYGAYSNAAAAVN